MSSVISGLISGLLARCRRQCSYPQCNEVVVVVAETVLFGIIAAAAVVVTVRLSVAIARNGQELYEDVNL